MGALGIMLAYMMYKEAKATEAHKQERDSWQQQAEKRTDQLREVVEKNTTATVQQSAAMDKLCDQIERNTCSYRKP